jgi:serine/threonine-protein kinase
VADIRERTLRELEANFKYYWHNLSQLEQETLLNLPAIVARLAQDTTLAHLLRDLTHKCLLVAEDGSYRYAFEAWADFVSTQADPKKMRDVNISAGMLSGTSVGPYEIQELLARGGMAEVYKGVHGRLGRLVAIKVLPLQLVGEGDFRRRFEREARAVAALKHPNIVQVFDFGDTHDTCYLVMEYIDGKDLTNYLREHPGPMPLGEALPILHDVANALDYAHTQGVIHRDIKPSNVLLEIVTMMQPTQLPYRAILTDFGIAKLIAGTGSTTGTGMMGTIDYMAPEQIQSARTVDGYADIYALGVLAYRLLTGVLPFASENPGEVLMGHLYRPLTDPRTFVPDLPVHMVDALQRAMTKEPGQRFPTASQFVAALSPG